MKSRRILVMTTIWPHAEHSERAANIVFNELISALARHTDGSVGLLVAQLDALQTPDEQERAALEQLQRLGVRVLDPVMLRSARRERSRLARVLRPEFNDYYPANRDAERLRGPIDEFKPDLIMVPWSEWLTAVVSEMPGDKLAYYGNPDPKALRMQIDYRARVGELNSLRAWHLRRRADRLEKFHLGAMMKYRWVGDVASNDADYYARMGHPSAFYIQNIWSRSRGTAGASPEGGVCKIIANVGRVSATANTLGLEYLATRVLPCLRQRFGGQTFELHILGAGVPHPHVARLLAQPEVVMRGFVDDVDAEIAGAHAFLCVNNATAYKVGHTRYLHAWSLGACVVGHEDVRLSMPEFVSEENALLGNSESQIADHLYRVYREADLAARLRVAGKQTFLEHFTADQVVPSLLKRVSGTP